MPEYGALSRSIFDGKCSVVFSNEVYRTLHSEDRIRRVTNEALYFLAVTVNDLAGRKGFDDCILYP
jgi:hypothetical protein